MKRSLNELRATVVERDADVRDLLLTVNELRDTLATTQQNADTTVLRIFTTFTQPTGQRAIARTANNGGTLDSELISYVLDGPAICIEGAAGQWDRFDAALNFQVLLYITDSFSPSTPLDLEGCRNVPLTDKVTAIVFPDRPSMEDFVTAWASRPEKHADLELTTHA